MRYAFAVCVLLLGIMVAGQAGAQALYQKPEIAGGFRSRAGRPPVPAGPEASPYGGGFIEFLMTGREPTPDMRPRRPVPFADRSGVVYGGPHIAALPGTPQARDA